MAMPAPSESLARAPRIWAVGGGKGGVGKSVVTSSLAAAMAGLGHRVAVIDADLGAANLHTLLGAARPRVTLSHFLTGEVGSLAEVMLQTSVPNLWLVSGHQALLEMANPKRREREQLARQIQMLDVDDVLLDLGAGSAFNVLDLFLLAQRGLVVVTPEPTAIENAEHFLRAAVYRSLRFVARRPDVNAAIAHLRDEHHKRRVRSAQELIALVREIDPTAAKPLEERAKAFAPLLIVNQVQSVEHRRTGPNLVESCRDRLGVAIELAASLDSDPSVRAAVEQRQPAVQAFPLCRFSRQIESVARRLLHADADRPRDPARIEPARTDAPTRPLRVVDPPAGRSTRRPPLPPLDPAEPGAYLRRCRETLALTLSEMTERTRIRNLDHIECERFERLPAELYLKSYVTAYARELGVRDCEALAAAYLEKCRNRARVR
ncbi:MAG TPA: P-loop NTPase [Myxococcota bacterium]|nr:P-loop NTPase [Myxococcota bacterium]